MTFLPEWAPNVHPLVVHFPIALVGAVAAYVTGQEAGESVLVEGGAVGAP